MLWLKILWTQMILIYGEDNKEDTIVETLITPLQSFSQWAAEQIEICTVDIATLAFRSVLGKQNDDRRVKTNWCAPNLHIDWELHQASLMSTQKKRLWRWDWWLWWSCHWDSYLALWIKKHTHLDIINYNVSPSHLQEGLRGADVY